ncbi:MAG: nicotinate phosphoribosyltransferase [Bacteroidales bacterium]|nr:nicotinate phosphoribosyltransferase [Bacteroidales bacterium]HQK36005.1 nicotinate phosphoribosyltransferase [Bacteroidales bacterium]
MIINYFTDNDLYKFTTMNAIQKLYPEALARYRFFNRGETPFPEGFDRRLAAEVNHMASVVLSREEEEFMRRRCYYLDPVFFDLLKGYRYNPEEVTIRQQGGNLEIEIEGPWYRTVLWEVPLLAMISELYYTITGKHPEGIEERAIMKAEELKKMEADFSEFGTRRRFSFEVQDRVIQTLIAHSGRFFLGTSNVYFAMKHQLTPMGTHPHEWFMYHAAHFGYRMANTIALEKWVDVYHGSLGIALADTFTSEAFFRSFTLKHAKLFDGVRWDSGDPIEFTEKTIRFYEQNRIDPRSKTIVYSDALNLEEVRKIKQHVNGRIHDAYGIGTFLTNDVGVTPLNIVIKMTAAKPHPRFGWVKTVKLSDVPGKHTGDEEDIQLCLKMLNL